MVVPLIANVENMNVVVPEWKDHPVGPAQMKVCLISMKRWSIKFILESYSY